MHSWHTPDMFTHATFQNINLPHIIKEISKLILALIGTL